MDHKTPTSSSDCRHAKVNILKFLSFPVFIITRMPSPKGTTKNEKEGYKICGAIGKLRLVALLVERNSELTLSIP